MQQPFPQSTTAGSQATHLPTIDPLHHLTFGQPPEVRSIAFAPDGTTAYVQINDSIIDAWDVLIYLWPELLGALLLLITLPAFIILLKRLRKREQPGHIYCRKCGYDLTGKKDMTESDTRCSECGVLLAKRKPRQGRVRRRSLIFPALMILIPTGAYAAMHIAQFPRTNAYANNLASYPSPKLDEFAKRNNWHWLTNLRTQGTIVQEFNLTTGTWGRIIHAHHAPSYWELTLSPSGDAFYHYDYKMPGVIRVSIATGAIKSTGALGKTFEIQHQVPIVTAHDAGDRYVWIFGVSESDMLHHLYRWDVQTGSIDEQFTSPAYGYNVPVPSAPRSFPVARVMKPLSYDTGRKWLSVPTFMESFNRKVFELVIHDEHGSIDRSIDLGQTIDWTADPAVSPDGTTAFLPALHGTGVIGLDLKTGENLGTLRLDRQNHIWQLQLSADGSRLFVAADSVHVRDINSRQWRAILTIPSALYAPHLTTSPDGRWLGAICQRNPTAAESQRGVQFAHDLLIWDLTKLNAIHGQAKNEDNTSSAPSSP